jgi:hypothetical protein
MVYRKIKILHGEAVAFVLFWGMIVGLAVWQFEVVLAVIGFLIVSNTIYEALKLLKWVDG